MSAAPVEQASLPSRILVVEDDPQIGPEVVSGLIREGFDAVLAADGDRAAGLLRGDPFDLVVLDLMLPGLGGFELLEIWEGRTSVPVIVLTARRDLEDRLRSFELGAVDFLPKPFFFEELLMRIRIRLGLRTVDRPRRTESIGRCEVDLDGREVLRDGVSVGLTAHEFNLLAVLVGQPGRAFTRDLLAERALPENGMRLDRTVDTHISRIRRKLGDDGQAIRTVFGVGYRFDPT